MAIEFICHSCNQKITVKFLKPGETASCKNCGAKNIIPEPNSSVGGSVLCGLKSKIKNIEEKITEPESIFKISEEKAQEIINRWIPKALTVWAIDNFFFYVLFRIDMKAKTLES